MKLSVSNLGFRGLSIAEYGPILQSHQINAIEISLNEAFGSLESAESDAEHFLSELHRYNLVVSGIQSLLYGKTELQLLRKTDWDDLESHLTRIIRIASSLKTSVLVLGSPKNRLKGNLTDQTSFNLLAEFLTRLIPTLQNNQVQISIEPNAAYYGADFLRNYDDVVNFCHQFGSPHVVPQIDTGCLELEDNDLNACLELKLPAHIHLSSPGLGSIIDNVLLPSFIKQVYESSYQGWMTIEMLGNGKQGLIAVAEAARMVRNGI
jgi:sugar phosphate isomerase/epimerase